MNEIFNKKEFAIEEIATGSFIDVPGGLSDSIYHVETKTIRLNYIALDEWFDGQVTTTKDMKLARTSRKRFATRSAMTTGTASRSRKFSARYSRR